MTQGYTDLAQVDEDLEEGVHQKDAVSLDAACVQEHRLQGQREWTI